ncbi:MAG: hypothetical protein ICV64_03105 [Thermoleophilia bacterium]|nr:hypothetical protein [Thermoleophilia bacterium]
MLAFAFSDAAYVALAVFLLAFAYALVRLGGTFGRLSALIKGTQDELLPVFGKVGGTVDRVNAQLDKVDVVTDSAVDAADAADTAVRAVSVALKRPVEKLSGLAAGLTYGLAELKARRDVRRAVEVGREAARRRERELADELADAGRRA